MKIRHVLATLLAATATFCAAGAAYADSTAICYNCPPEWADWASQIAAIQKQTGIRVPFDNKNSGQAIAQMMAEQKSPIADVVYLGVSSAFQAKDKGLVQPYKPAHWNDIPAGMKDPNGYWFAIHSGTLGFFVNKDALEGKPVPRSWADLLKPEYKGMVGYLDPSSAFVGYAGAVAVNQALGGTLDNFKPGLDWFAKMKANAPIVPKQTAYARVMSGEIPILLDYDFDAYRAKYKDHANVEFVIPKEGTIVGAVCDEPREGRAASGERREGAGFRAVRRRPAPVGQRVSASGARRNAAARNRRQIPAGIGLCARQGRRLREDGREAKRVRRRVSCA